MAAKKGAISQAKQLLTGIFVGGNIASLIILYIFCASTWLDPASHPRVAVMGLFFPFILFFNFVFIPFWLIFKRKMVAVPIIGMLFCCGFIFDYFPVSLIRNPEFLDSTLTIISWNTDAFGGAVDSGWEDAANYLEQSGADIFCLIENEVPAVRVERFNAWADSAGFHQGQQFKGRVIYSRYPILSGEDIPMDTKINNGACCYHLLIQDDTVNLIIVHLESDRLSVDDKDEYHEMVNSHQRQELEDGGRMLLEKLSAAAAIRGPQVDILTHYLDSIKGQSVILCGDFNDTPISYSYQQINHRLENAFRHSGNGIGVTYNQAYFWVRIDHLFYSDDWESVSTKVDESTECSDHYPLVTTLKKQEK